MAQPRTRSQRSRLLALLTGCLVALAGSGCATLERHAACGLVGGSIGGTLGVIYGVTQSDIETTEAVGVGVGALAGGVIIGYSACIVADMVQNK